MSKDMQDKEGIWDIPGVEENIVACMKAGKPLPAVQDRYLEPLHDYLDARFTQIQNLVMELLKTEVGIQRAESKLDKFMSTLIKLMEAKGEGHDWEALAKEEDSHD